MDSVAPVACLWRITIVQEVNTYTGNQFPFENIYFKWKNPPVTLRKCVCECVVCVQTIDILNIFVFVHFSLFGYGLIRDNNIFQVKG